LNTLLQGVEHEPELNKECLMTWKYIAAIAAFFAVAAVAPAKEQGAEPAAPQVNSKSQSPDKNDAEAVDILRQMEGKYASISTVSGSFQQTLKSSSWDDVHSKAQFYLQKPNKFRADYVAPHESTELITDDFFYRYTKELKQVDEYKFQNRATVQDLNYMLLGFGARVDDILRVYQVHLLTKGVADGYYGIQLTPNDKKSASFEYITILITKNELRPAQFSMEQGVNRITADLDLQTLKIGGSISSGIFQPNWPKGVNIVPLQ
jgi:outer membrane lipoprotein-sorting protein